MKHKLFKFLVLLYTITASADLQLGAEVNSKGIVNTDICN